MIHDGEDRILSLPLVVASVNTSKARSVRSTTIDWTKQTLFWLFKFSLDKISSFDQLVSFQYINIEVVVPVVRVDN